MILFLQITILSVNVAAQDFKAIVGGTLINTHKKEIIKNSIILIKDSLIIDIGSSIKRKIPDVAKIIDATGKFIIPGLIDSHVHFFQSGGLYTRPDGLDLRHRVPYNDEINRIKENISDVFKRYIRCGITTVIDNGGPFWNFDVRAKSSNDILSPRVFVAGPLISSYQPEAFKIDDAPIVKVSTSEEAIKLAQKQIDKKTDLLKIWYIVVKDSSSMGNVPNQEPGIKNEDFDQIVREVAYIASKNHIPLFVHATELETAKKAIRAGCKVLVHIITDKEVDDEFLKLAIDSNVSIVPTLWVLNSYEAVYSKQLKLTQKEHWLGNPTIISTLFDMYELSYDELGERQKKLQIEMKPIEPDPIIIKNLRKIYEYGIPIAAGTDAGNVGVLHGPSLYREFDYMKKAGLSNHDILIAATHNGAKIIGKNDRIGSIEKNKLADLIILNSNPLEDIQNTSDINLIVKNGVISKPEDIIKYEPQDIAQIQLNAYNSGDLETFLSAYSSDVEVYTFPAQLRYKGLSEMREVYGKFFAQSSKLHCKLLNRITFGNYVIDRELVQTGMPGRDNIEATAIYEIKDGKIVKVWFMN